MKTKNSKILVTQKFIIGCIIFLTSNNSFGKCASGIVITSLNCDEPSRAGMSKVQACWKTCQENKMTIFVTNTEIDDVVGVSETKAGSGCQSTKLNSIAPDTKIEVTGVDASGYADQRSIYCPGQMKFSD